MTDKRAHAVRIIAGRWKGRRIPVETDGIRPSSDRVRETLFNWLAGHIQGARCLDMFAGTGVLGLEALSRGAALAVFVERNKAAARHLREQLIRLECHSAAVISADARRLDYAEQGPFDVVFLDPPFEGLQLADLCTLLESSRGLAATAHIYLEMSKRQDLPELPANWTIIRTQTAGQVRYALAERRATTLPEKE